MGFRTPSEITKELEAYETKKKRESEAFANRFGKKSSGPREILEPAGYGQRLLASVIDGLAFIFISGLPLLILAFVSLKVTEVITDVSPFTAPEVETENEMSPTPSEENVAALQSQIQQAFWLFSVLWLASLALVTSLYFGFFYSRYGGGPGKLVFQLEVRDDFDEKRVGSVRAFFREFVMKYLLGGIMLIGYLFLFFNPARRGLHDFLTGTRVVKVTKLDQASA